MSSNKRKEMENNSDDEDVIGPAPPTKKKKGKNELNDKCEHILMINCLIQN